MKKLIHYIVIAILGILWISAVTRKGEKYPVAKTGASAGLSQNNRQYNFFYQCRGKRILFEYTYFDQIFKEAYKFAAKDDLTAPVMINETSENVYNSLGVGYTFSILNLKEKFQINMPVSVYSGFGSRERITYSKKEGYVETPDLKNKSYLVFGLKNGISAEFKLNDRFHFGLSNFFEYEMDGKRPPASMPADTKLYLWNPFFSLIFLP